jgi:ADP-ribose pyrophosphatase YjhB (NUDIX family)
LVGEKASERDLSEKVPVQNRLALSMGLCIGGKHMIASAMPDEPKWIKWARELQAIAQTGLHFSESQYDRERYEQILSVSVEMFAEQSSESPALIRNLFEKQSGYATPKVDVRGVVFHENKILLIQEKSDGLWSLPGGWADVNDAPSEAVEREIVEETGFDTKAREILALFDRAKHPHEPPFPFHIYKLFIKCEITGGEAKIAMETSALGFFGLSEIPPLSISRVTQGQIEFCFQRHLAPPLPCAFD